MEKYESLARIILIIIGIVIFLIPIRRFFGLDNLIKGVFGLPGKIFIFIKDIITSLK